MKFNEKLALNSYLLSLFRVSSFENLKKSRFNNLDNLICDEDHYKVKLIEQEFKKLMFGE